MRPDTTTLLKRLALPATLTAVSFGFGSFSPEKEEPGLGSVGNQGSLPQLSQAAIKTPVVGIFTRVGVTVGLASVLIVGAVWSIERRLEY